MCHSLLPRCHLVWEFRGRAREDPREKDRDLLHELCTQRSLLGARQPSLLYLIHPLNGAGLGPRCSKLRSHVLTGHLGRADCLHSISGTRSCTGSKSPNRGECVSTA